MTLIGPHEGKEFDLMEQGQKHVALFYEIIPDQLHSFAADPGYAVIAFDRRLDVAGKSLSIPYVILYRKGHEPAAEELSHLVNHPPSGFDAAKERRIGEILGYPQEAIDHYLAQWPKTTKTARHGAPPRPEPETHA